MPTYTQNLCHIVIATKDRLPVLADSPRVDLFRQVNGVIKNTSCRPIWTNAVTGSQRYAIVTNSR